MKPLQNKPPNPISDSASARRTNAVPSREVVLIFEAVRILAPATALLLVSILLFLSTRSADKLARFAGTKATPNVQHRKPERLRSELNSDVSDIVLQLRGLNVIGIGVTNGELAENIRLLTTFLPPNQPNPKSEDHTGDDIQTSPHQIPDASTNSDGDRVKSQTSDEGRLQSSEFESNDANYTLWTLSQEWVIVLFQSESGYDAKVFERTVEDFFAVRASRKFSISILLATGSANQKVKLIASSSPQHPIANWDAVNWSGFRRPGTTENPDEIVDEVVRQFHNSAPSHGAMNRHCLLIVSGRCQVPTSNEWKTMRIHACVLDDSELREKHRGVWSEFCRVHGGGRCRFVSSNLSEKLGARVASGEVREWLESVLERPPPDARIEENR